MPLGHIGETMVTRTIPLTEQENNVLLAIAQQTGKSQDVLLHEAVQRLIAEFQQSHQTYQRRLTRRKRIYRTEKARQGAREQFERHFGTLNIVYPTGADNESIDADLAKAYANEYEAN